MTPPSAVLDRPDAPDISAAPIPTRDEVLQAIRDEGPSAEDAELLYEFFQELTADLKRYRQGEPAITKLFDAFQAKYDDDSACLMTRTVLWGTMHQALLRIMADDETAAEGSAHQALQQHFLTDIGGATGFLHTTHDSCHVDIIGR